MGKKVYISEIFASAFYEKVVKASREMTTEQLYKELGHVKSLSETNCGWGEYEIRNVVIKYLQEKIGEREYHAAQHSVHPTRGSVAQKGKSKSKKVAKPTRR